jgi:NADPH2:quinone reductase
MTAPVQDHFLQLRSTVLEEGKLQLSLEEVPTPKLEDGEVLVRIEASPINPSDLGLLFGVADMSTAEASGTSELPVITATIPEKLGAVKPRIGASPAFGNEGAGVVVAAGKDPAAQALLGRTVGTIGGAMYSQYRAVPANREIKTTFASSYTREVSLAEALTLEAIADYGRQATGTEYLMNPNKS